MKVYQVLQRLIACVSGRSAATSTAHLGEVREKGRLPFPVARIRNLFAFLISSLWFLCIISRSSFRSISGADYHNAIASQVAGNPNMKCAHRFPASFRRLAALERPRQTRLKSASIHPCPFCPNSFWRYRIDALTHKSHTSIDRWSSDGHRAHSRCANASRSACVFTCCHARTGARPRSPGSRGCRAGNAFSQVPVEDRPHGCHRLHRRLLHR